jgi:hypothetical protein
MSSTPLPPAPLPSPRRASNDSTSSAADRLQWRNHEHVLTPQPGQAEQNPFDVLALSRDAQTAAAAAAAAAGVEEAVEEEEEEEAEQAKSDGTSSDEQTNNVGRRPQDSRVRNVLDHHEVEDKDEMEVIRRNGKLGWRERLRHFTWTWVRVVMEERREEGKNDSDTR